MRRSWAFIPFVIAGVSHLAALFLANQALAMPTKAMLMPTLLLGLLVALPARRSEVALWGGLALLFAWAGDVLLGTPGELGFLIGLGSFLIAHLFYLVLYLRPLRVRALPWPTAIFGVWWVILVIILLPHVGPLAIPVALYGLVLCVGAAVAFMTTRVVALGALLFLVSDTILAFRMFHPDFGLWQQDFVIMTFYIAGQGLIIVGAVRFAQLKAAELKAAAKLPA